VGEICGPIVKTLPSTEPPETGIHLMAFYSAAAERGVLIKKKEKEERKFMGKLKAFRHLPDSLYRQRWPTRLYNSSGAGSGVVLRHRAAAAACVSLTVDAAAAAAYCTPPRLGQRMVFCTAVAQIQSVLQNIFSNTVFTALHVMQTRYSDENSVRPSVCPSVCPSHA